MTTLFVRHKVNDYSNWKRVYDESASTRKGNGVTSASVHRDSNDADTIIVVHQFKDMNAAMGFANSGELKSVMADAGVSGRPEMWFGEEIESTPY